MVPDPVPQLTPEQRNGRQLLVLGLALLGAIPMLTLYIMRASPVALFGCMIAYGLVFNFAFRGGQIALGLLKGFSLLMGLVFTVMSLAIAIRYVNDGGLPAQPGRSPFDIILPAFFAYFAIGVLFFSKKVRVFLDFQRNRSATLLIALLLLAPAFSGAQAAAPATPEAVPLDRYESLLRQSPFAPSSAPVAAAPAPSFAKDFYLTGLARIGDKAFASISSRDQQTRFSLLEGESYEGMTFSGVEWSPAVGRSRIILTKSGTTGSVAFDEMAMKAAPAPITPPPVANAAAQPSAEGRRDRGRRRWEEGRGRWRDRDGSHSSEQRRFMREQRRAWFRATHGQNQQGAGGTQGNQLQRTRPIQSP